MESTSGSVAMSANVTWRQDKISFLQLFSNDVIGGSLFVYASILCRGDNVLDFEEGYFLASARLLRFTFIETGLPNSCASLVHLR